MAFVRFSGRDVDINNHPAEIINSRVLLVGRLEPAISTIGRHCGVRVGNAHLLVAAGLAPLFSGQLIGSSVTIYLLDRLDMTEPQGFPS